MRQFSFKKCIWGKSKDDAFAKSSQIVMPDLIRHPEVLDFTEFRISPQ
jgi:hypothetical protein